MYEAIFEDGAGHPVERVCGSRAKVARLATAYARAMVSEALSFRVRFRRDDATYLLIEAAAELDLTRGQKDALVRAGLIYRCKEKGCSGCWHITPGETWASVDARIEAYVKRLVKRGSK